MSQKDLEYFIPTPPAHLFAYQKTAEEVILRENQNQFVIEKMETHPDKGIQIYYKGIPFPKKGFPTFESVAAINIAKKALLECIKTLSMWQMSISWLLILCTSGLVNKYDGVLLVGTKKAKGIDALLASFNMVVYRVISKYILKPEYMSPFASEFQGLVFVFLARFGVNKEIAREFASIFGTIIEYDNAYRYRLEDLFSETTKNQIALNPRKEFNRITKLYLEREGVYMLKPKFKYFFKLISVLLFIPRVKYTIRQALRHCEFERLQYDEADRYWCKIRTDYLYEGKTHEERMKGIEIKGEVRRIVL